MIMKYFILVENEEYIEVRVEYNNNKMISRKKNANRL